MQTQIAILRGINVSGQKKILMNDLKVLLGNMGLSAIQTYIQSGNVVFEFAASGVAQKIQEIIMK